MKKKQTSYFKLILPWVAFFLILISISSLFTNSNTKQVNYNELMDIIETKEVTEVSISPDEYLIVNIEGTYEEDGSKVTFKSQLVHTDEEVNKLMDQLNENGIAIKVKNSANNNVLLSFLIAVVPYVLIIGVFILLMISLNIIPCLLTYM